jgi:hypothetical protein
MLAASKSWYRPYVDIERLNQNDLRVYNVITKFGSRTPFIEIINSMPSNTN